jgi:hypothetical protein
MSRDPRAQELNNLKLALATFALQLDAFEARLRHRSSAIADLKHGPLDVGFATRTTFALKTLPSADQASRSPDELDRYRPLPKVNPLSFTRSD